MKIIITLSKIKNLIANANLPDLQTFKKETEYWETP